MVSLFDSDKRGGNGHASDDLAVGCLGDYWGDVGICAGVGHRGAHTAMIREVQFEVQRNCPVSSPDPDFVLAEPFAIWVEWPAIKAPLDYACQARLYRITPQGLAEMLRRNASGSRSFPTVCEHMGRIIE